jgi:hypothetical protein
MLAIRVACSGCPDETYVLVEKIDDVDHLFCDCDYSYIVLSVSEALAI